MGLTLQPYNVPDFHYELTHLEEIKDALILEDEYEVPYEYPLQGYTATVYTDMTEAQFRELMEWALAYLKMVKSAEPYIERSAGIKAEAQNLVQNFESKELPQIFNPEYGGIPVSELQAAKHTRNERIRQEGLPKTSAR